MRTSAGPSTGGGASPSWRTLSSPGSRTRMARMALRSPWRAPGVNAIWRTDMDIAVGGLVVALAAAVWWLARRVRGAERGLAVTRAHLAEGAGGEPPPRDVIVRGAPFRSIEAAPALVLYQQQPDL